MDRTIQCFTNWGLYKLLNQEYIEHFKPLISLQLIEKSSIQLNTITIQLAPGLEMKPFIWQKKNNLLFPETIIHPWANARLHEQY